MKHHPKWGDRTLVKQEGDLVMIARKDVDIVVLFDKDSQILQRRVYFFYPTRTTTRQEARAMAEKEFARRLPK